MAKRLAVLTTPLASLSAARPVMLLALAMTVPSLLVSALGTIKINPKYLRVGAVHVRGVFARRDRITPPGNGR